MGNLWCLRFAPALLETFTPLFTRGRKQLQASCVLLWRVASQGQKFFSIIKLVFLFLRQMFLRSKPKDKSRVSDVNNFGIFMVFVSVFQLTLLTFVSLPRLLRGSRWRFLSLESLGRPLPPINALTFASYVHISFMAAVVMVSWLTPAASCPRCGDFEPFFPGLLYLISNLTSFN